MHNATKTDHHHRWDEEIDKVPTISDWPAALISGVVSLRCARALIVVRALVLSRTFQYAGDVQYVTDWRREKEIEGETK